MLTLLIYVRSKEDNPLGPTPLDIYLLYYLLRGLFPCFLLLGRIIIKEWGSNPTQRLKFSPPQKQSWLLFFFFLSIKNSCRALHCHRAVAAPFFFFSFLFFFLVKKNFAKALIAKKKILSETIQNIDASSTFDRMLWLKLQQW